MTDKLIGTKPNQVPSNADLGDLAYQNADFPTMNNLRLTGSMIIGDESTISGGSGLGRTLTVPDGSSGDLFLFGPSPEIGFLDANLDRSSAIDGNDGAIKFSSYSGPNSNAVNAIIDGSVKATSPSNLMAEMTRVNLDSSGNYSSGGDLDIKLGNLKFGGTVVLANTGHATFNIDDATEYSTSEASELNPVGTDVLYLNNSENSSTYGKVSILMRSNGGGGGASARITLQNRRSGSSALGFFMRDNAHTAEQKEKMYLDSDGNLSLTGTGAVVITATPGTTPGNNSAISLGRADGSSNVQMNTALTVDVAISGIAGVSVGSTNSNTPATRLRSANSASGHIVIAPKGTEKIRITAAEGHMLPADTNQDLGSASQPWQNIYTQDLNLSNEKRDEGNSVDGTKGNWTIQEGDEHLYIINNKSGKRFRFALEEIE